MKYRQDLLAGFFGVALLAMPIAAAAQSNDTNKDNSRPTSVQPRESSQPKAAPERSVAPERSNAAPERSSAMTRNPNEARHAEANASGNPSEERQATKRTEATSEKLKPENMTQGETRDRNVKEGNARATAQNDNNGEHRDYDNGRAYSGDRHDGDHDRGNDTYAYSTNVYVMPEGYSGGPCAWARHLKIIFDRDRATGHPAAADDLLPQLHRAERACG